MSRNVRLNVLFAIRDCRDLCLQEAFFLTIIEERGITYARRETLLRDMRMSPNTFDKWKNRLKERGVLIVTERPGATTVYEVDASWFETESPQNLGGAPSSVEDPAPPNPGGVGTQSLRLKENPKGDPVRGPSRRLNSGGTTLQGIESIGERGPAYVRLVRDHELDHEERAAVADLDSEQTAERLAQIECEWEYG